MTLSDNEIWDNIKVGEKKSFELLFNRYHTSLCLCSFGMVKNEAVAEEIVNDVFLKIWQKRSQIQINFGIKAYLFRSVINASNDYIEQNKALLQNSFIELDEQINQIVGINEDYIFDILQSEGVEKDVVDAINNLPKQCKLVFCLSRFEFLTYNEISERLNISVNTVKTQMSRAMESLREQLGKYL
jgi:RNA polymerase sigma-70 factor (ECF subfamily)